MTIGVLLPRSTDFPAMGFDLLDGLRAKMNHDGISEIRFVPENIGFGENKKEIYAKAEKLLLQDEADIIVGYLSHANAELLYPLLATTGKLLVALDAGMSFPSEKPTENVVHISLQGMHAAYLSGRKAGENGAKVIMATSFYDGGYRGPWAYHRGIQDTGGSIVNNYVGHYKESEFTIAPFLDAVNHNNDSHIAACFSTYLSSLFINSLSKESDALPNLNFYCSSYMLEEQTMATYKLPGGNFYAYVPWSSTLKNENNTGFIDAIRKRKDKAANIFHLLGWEAATVAAHWQQQRESNGLAKTELAGWSYQSPRGVVTIHPETHISVAPLYFAEMRQEKDAAARVVIHDSTEIDSAEHLRMMADQPSGVSSGWFNNYLCT